MVAGGGWWWPAVVGGGGRWLPAVAGVRIKDFKSTDPSKAGHPYSLKPIFNLFVPNWSDLQLF